jgi:hypothetical protein
MASQILRNRRRIQEEIWFRAALAKAVPDGPIRLNSVAFSREPVMLSSPGNGMRKPDNQQGIAGLGPAS